MSYGKPHIPIHYLDGSEKDDWALYVRSDAFSFDCFVPICLEADLPVPSSANFLSIYYCPLGLLFDTLPEVVIWKQRTQLLQYESLSPTATFDGGKTKGCSGSPIVDSNGRVVAFLRESMSEMDAFLPATSSAQGARKRKSPDTVEDRLKQVEEFSALSSDSGYASYLIGAVLCKLPALLSQL